MARGVLTPKVPARSGTHTIATATANSTDDHEFSNSAGKNFLIIINGSASPFVTTIPTPATVESLAIGEKEITVAAGATAIFGPFPRSGVYSQTDELIHVDPASTDGDVRYGVIRL